MSGYRAPYRILAVKERCEARPELKDCDIRLEELPPEREDGYFPSLQHDTVRVFIERDEFSINVMGKLTDGFFDYQVNVYDKNGPSNPQFWAKMTHIDELVDFVVKRFKERFS